MLKITVITEESFDESTQKFIHPEEFVLELEHSLISLSKWESEYQKPFLVAGIKEPEEIIAYIKAMIITENYPVDIVYKFNTENIQQVNEYIDSKQSATTFGINRSTRGKTEIITSELIYYWMVAFNIPFECETWHLNRLFALIRICNVKNSKPTKMSQAEIAARNRELNAQRRTQLGTTG